ncbi:hypothetical protein AB0N81_17750 [Streptomyces sp. NPDC093510]|uniref:hypothetical protein n=1 Tax=Streptomyces sp. NPDC093510 TaxID=3155199 RepID=UPI003442F79D
MTEETTDTTTRAAGTSGAGDAAVEPSRPWWHWRELTRGRLRPAVAAALAGALLGGTMTAWQAEAGPFAARERACWGALGEDDVADLFNGRRDIDASEIPVATARFTTTGPTGVCRLASPRGHRVTARVHQLDERFGGASDQWADEYLSARMTPFGDGLLGMVSDTRAWLAVPEGCVGRPSEYEGPLVIDMETGLTDYDREVDTGERDRLARALVGLVNGYMADQGCDRAISEPVGRLSAPARFEQERRDAICGVKGLRLPVGRKPDALRSPLVTRGAGAPVRTCDRYVSLDHPRLRLMTIEDPRLSVLYDGQALHRAGARGIKGTPDDAGVRGFLGDDLGLVQASCQSGDVTFLIRAQDATQAGAIRALLPRYVAAEADRIGCGPLRVELPGGERG